MKKAFVSVMLMFIGVLASAQSENDFGIVQEGGGVTVTGYAGTLTEIVIPAKISGLPVYSIGKNAFANKRLTKVTLPEGLKIIDESAFANNRLTSVVIPNTVISIVDDAFLNNQITELTLSNRLALLGSGAFQKNRIENLTIPASLDYISYGTFGGCPIKILNLGGAKTVQMAFSGSAVEKIMISANVTIIPICGLDASFINFYKDNGKKAGTYIKNDRIWIKQ